MPSLSWIGKEKIENHDKEVPFRLLKKNDKLSLGKSSENLIVEGDNLEALKALMPHYAGQVKCIYIDPPYNTLSDKWEYNDRVDSPRIREWLKQTVDRDDLERHDKWLCMMYPRLKLLEKLMKDAGVIFISIDDNEVHNLRYIMDEIFGEENFIGYITWYKKRKGSFLSKTLISLTEYIVAYKKGSKNVPLFGGRPDSIGSQPIVKRTNARKELKFIANTVTTKLKDGVYEAGIYGTGTSSVELKKKITIKNGIIINDFILEGPFTWGQSMLEEELLKGSKITINTKNFQPRAIRVYEDEEHKGLPSFIDGREFSATTDDAYEDLRNIFNTDRIFNYSKPKNLISYLINAVTFGDKNAIILDSFAGSGTTAHAVLQLNKDEKGSNRKFILVEVEDKIAQKITSERVRRVAKHLGGDFEYATLGDALFESSGAINHKVNFKDLASYIYFTETHTNINPKKIKGNFVGEYNGQEMYLIFKDKDKNILNRAFLSKLNKSKLPKVVYADKCLLDQNVLDKYGIVFKQIPYSVKTY